MKVKPSTLKRFYVNQIGEFACGLACLSTISKFYGGEAKQEKLMAISGTTFSGTTLLGLIQAANEIGIEGKGFEAEIPHLKKQERPVILHVVLDNVREHYMVCFGYDGSRFWLSDPGFGIISMEENVLSDVWKSRILLQMTPTENFRTDKNESNSKMEWFNSIISKDIPILIVAAVLGTVMAITGLSTAIFSQKLIDDFLPNQAFDKAVLGVIFLGLLLVFRSLIGYFQGIFMAMQGRDLNIRIVSSFIGKILNLPMRYFQGFSTGDLIARMNDSLRIKNTVSLITGTVIINFLVLVVSLVFVFYQSLIIGGICIAGITAFLYVGWKYHQPIIDKHKEVMSAHALNENQYIDSLTGIQVMKSYGKEQVFQHRINQVYTHYQEKDYDLSVLGNKFSFFTQVIVAVFTSLLFGIGVILIFQKQLQLGELMAVIQVGSSIIPATAGLVVANIQFQEAKVAFDRMHEIAGINQNEEYFTALHQNEADKNCLLAVKNVVFRYPGRKAIINDISFHLRERKSLALFAPVGSGKSTLVDLIQRFYSPEQGSIEMPFLMEKEWDINTWRAQIGVVNQREKIFNSTILDNIALSNINEEIEATAKQLQDMGWWFFFEALPQGILTLCGEEGRNLSAGQRQMVGLARAMVRKPKILILDEATSAMDFETEDRVFKLVKEYLNHHLSSLLLITHQPTLAVGMDEVMILDQGKISSIGSPTVLLQENNLLSKFCQNVFELNRK